MLAGWFRIAESPSWKLSLGDPFRHEPAISKSGTGSIAWADCLHSYLKRNRGNQGWTGVLRLVSCARAKDGVSCTHLCLQPKTISGSSLSPFSLPVGHWLVTWSVGPGELLNPLLLAKTHSCLTNCELLRPEAKAHPRETKSALPKQDAWPGCILGAESKRPSSSEESGRMEWGHRKAPRKGGLDRVPGVCCRLAPRMGEGQQELPLR